MHDFVDAMKAILVMVMFAAALFAIPFIAMILILAVIAIGIYAVIKDHRIHGSKEDEGP